jgi:hypothetical protein
MVLGQLQASLISAKKAGKKAIAGNAHGIGKLQS